MDQTRIIATRGVKEYRKMILTNITPNNQILEIGFAWGTTTNLIYSKCKNVIAIDKGESFNAAKEKYPYLKLYKIDAFDIRQILAFNIRFNKIFIDVSGCRELLAIIKLINIYASVFRPKLIIVKSTKLKRFVGLFDL